MKGAQFLKLIFWNSIFATLNADVLFEKNVMNLTLREKPFTQEILLGSQKIENKGTIVELIRSDSDGETQILWNEFFVSTGYLKGKGRTANIVYDYSENLIYLSLAEIGNNYFVVYEINPNSIAKTILPEIVGAGLERNESPVKNSHLTPDDSLVASLLPIYELRFEIENGEMIFVIFDKYGKSQKLKYSKKGGWGIING